MPRRRTGTLPGKRSGLARGRHKRQTIFRSTFSRSPVARSRRAKRPPFTPRSRPLSDESVFPPDNPCVDGGPLDLNFAGPRDLFRSLIAPLSEEEFFNAHWEKKPLVIKRGAHPNTPPLFTLATLQKLTRDSVPLLFGRHVNVCRYRNGVRRSYGSVEEGDELTYARLEQLWTRKKATVQFLQPQHFQDELWHLVSLLESYFSCLVGTNVYITPSGAQGLAPHYDDVEVFIVQLEGSKLWKLYPPSLPLPQSSSPDLSPHTIGPPSHHFLLETGDVLYFPRGTIHHASTPPTIPHSTHITISTYQQNAWGNLLSNAFNSTLGHLMSTELEYRTALPLHIMARETSSAVRDGARDRLRSMGENVLDHIYNHHQRVITSHSLSFIAARLPPFDQEREGGQGPTPSGDCMVGLRWPDHMVVVTGREVSEMTECGPDHTLDGGEVEEEGEGGEGEEEGEVYVYHSLANERLSHMMLEEGGVSKPHGVRLPVHHLPALSLLLSSPSPLPSSSLPLSPDDTHTLLLTLWVEGLLSVSHDIPHGSHD